MIIPRYINGEEHDSWNMMQYAKGDGRGKSQCNVPYFDHQPFDHETRQCGGVKICEFVRPDIRDITHTSVEPSTHMYQDTTESSSALQMTLAWYLEQKKKECPYEKPGYTDENGDFIPPQSVKV